MTLQELTTFDRVFQNYLNDNDHDEDARDLYIETMEAHTTHLEVWNDIFDYPTLKNYDEKPKQFPYLGTWNELT